MSTCCLFVGEMLSAQLMFDIFSLSATAYLQTPLRTPQGHDGNAGE